VATLVAVWLHLWQYTWQGTPMGELTAGPTCRVVYPTTPHTPVFRIKGRISRRPFLLPFATIDLYTKTQVAIQKLVFWSSCIVTGGSL
jgi:hypothetical protein